MVSFPQAPNGVAPETGGPVPFFIYSGEDQVADLEPLKAAKATMPDLPRIRPIRVTLANRFEFSDQELGWDSRILCIGYRLPWAGNYALVTEKTTPENLAHAIRWVVEGGDDPRASTIQDWLNHYLGPGVREISPEELESERKMRAYLNREE